MSLCTGIIELGNYDLCDTIVTGLTASATGTYKIQIQTNELYQEVNFTLGDPINFANPFNDDATHRFQVLTPAGAVMSLNGRNCFYVKINSRTHRDDSFLDSCLISGGSGSGSGITVTTFTTNGSGAATVAATIGKTVFVWTYTAGQQGVLLNQGGGEDYTFNIATGAFQLSDASAKTYLLMYQ